MDSIFGIGIFEFIFILIFALIFLGPERLPKVTKDTLNFIRRLQRLSGDLTKQINEEIGDLRELDPSHHMQQLMEDDEEEERTSKQSASQKSTSSSTKPPSQPAKTTGADADIADEDAKTEASADQNVADTIGSDLPTKAQAQQSLSDTKPSVSSNGLQRGGESADTKSETKDPTIASTPRASSSATTAKNRATGISARRTDNPEKRGVKSLAELRKQQRAKRQSNATGANSSYLEERDKRAQGRASVRREVMAAQKAEKDSASDAVVQPAADESAEHEVQAEQRSVDSSEPSAIAVTEMQEDTGEDGGEETPA